MNKLNVMMWAKKVVEVQEQTDHHVEAFTVWEKVLSGAIPAVKNRTGASEVTVHPQFFSNVALVSKQVPTLLDEDEVAKLERVFTILIDLSPDKGEHPLFIVRE